MAGLLYPPRCAICGRELDSLLLLCDACESMLPALAGTRCVRCGEPVEDGSLDLCLRCGTTIRFVDRSLFLGPYDSAWGALVRTLKFDRETAVAGYLGTRLTNMLREAGLDDSVDAVTFVPMSRCDRRARGFNQSELLARAVARRIDRPAKRLLAKTARTKPQGRLSASARRKNLRGAFRPIPWNGGRVLLVDDICTTGSTIEECAQALRRGGARTVTVLAVARA